MRRAYVVVLGLAACGRLHFGDSSSDEVLAIVTPLDNAEVDATATLVGTCKSGLPIEIGGSGLATPASASCEVGAFTATLVFGEGDGPKPVEVHQGDATVGRTFVRVTRAKLRAATAGTVASAGFMVDCDLVIEAPDAVAGDLLFGMIYTDGGGTGSVGTQGFNRSQLAGPTYVAFWKVVAAAEPVTYTFRIVAGTGTADTCEAAGVLAAFGGVEGNAPVLAQSMFAGSASTVLAPGVTAARRALLVGAWGSNGPATGFQTAMPVAGSAVSNNDFANALVGYETVEMGPTGDRAASLSASRPAAAGLFVLNGTP